MTFEIGFSREVITPELSRPVYLAGFGRNRQATRVHDQLTASAMSLTDGKQQLVLVALDLIGLGRSFYLDLAASLPDVQLVLSCTHTHHGPDTIGLWGPDLTTSGLDPLYMEFLKETVLHAARSSLSQRYPANMRATEICVPGVAKNARDPEIVDDELLVAQWTDPENDDILLTLLDFPCHPETLWTDNTSITSDYPYYLRFRIESFTGRPCVFLPGALGGMMTPDVEQHSFEEASFNGSTIALRGIKALAHMPSEPVTAFTYQKEVFSLPIQSPLLEQAMAIGLVDSAGIQDGILTTETSLLRAGPLGLIFVPGELLPALGQRLKANLHAAGVRAAGVVGLANDELGYILPDEDFQFPENPFEPDGHYEETMSVIPKMGSTLLKPPVA